MVLRYLVASYYVSLVLCAPQYFQSVVSYSERLPEPLKLSSARVASELSASEFDSFSSESTLSETLPASVPAEITSDVTTAFLESSQLTTTKSITAAPESTTSYLTGCRKLPGGTVPAGLNLEDMRPGRDSDCFKQYLATRSRTATASAVMSSPTTSRSTSSAAPTAASLASTLSTAASTKSTDFSSTSASTLSTAASTRSTASRSSGTTRSTATRSGTSALADSQATSIVWHPRVTNKSIGPTFQIILSGVPDLKPDAKRIVPDVDIYDIDLFRTEKKIIDTMKRLNKTVVCYFSGGTYEPSRPDSNQFAYADKGLRLAQWPSEMWVKTQSTSVRKIMTNRIQLARQKGCDAIDPDNIDAYGSGAGGGLGLTKRDSINYVQFLSTTAAKYNLAIGLKNSLEILPDVKHLVHFAVNEECVRGNECARYKDFLTKDKKPVFHIEYPSNDRQRVLNSADREKWCGGRAPAEVKSSLNFQTVIKTMSLNGWVLYCNGTAATTPISDSPGSRWSNRGSPSTQNAVVAVDDKMRLSMTPEEAEIARQDRYPFDLEGVELVKVEGEQSSANSDPLPPDNDQR